MMVILRLVQCHFNDFRLGCRRFKAFYAEFLGVNHKSIVNFLDLDACVVFYVLFYLNFILLWLLLNQFRNIWVVSAVFFNYLFFMQIYLYIYLTIFDQPKSYFIIYSIQAMKKLERLPVWYTWMFREGVRLHRERFPGLKLKTNWIQKQINKKYNSLRSLKSIRDILNKCDKYAQIMIEYTGNPDLRRMIQVRFMAKQRTPQDLETALKYLEVLIEIINFPELRVPRVTWTSHLRTIRRRVNAQLLQAPLQIQAEVIDQLPEIQQVQVDFHQQIGQEFVRNQPEVYWTYQENLVEFIEERQEHQINVFNTNTRQNRKKKIEISQNLPRTRSQNRSKETIFEEQIPMFSESPQKPQKIQKPEGTTTVGSQVEGSRKTPSSPRRSQSKRGNVVPKNNISKGNKRSNELSKNDDSQGIQRRILNKVPQANLRQNQSENESNGIQSRNEFNFQDIILDQIPIIPFWEKKNSDIFDFQNSS